MAIMHELGPCRLKVKTVVELTSALVDQKSEGKKKENKMGIFDWCLKSAFFMSFFALVILGCATVVTNPQQVFEATQVKFDPYTNFYSVSGMRLNQGGFPNATYLWMEGGFDKYGKNGNIHLYVYHWNQIGWKFLNQASDITGTPLIVHPLNRIVNRDATVEEHLTIDLPRDYLENRKMQGLNIRIVGSEGLLMVEVPGAYIVGFLERFDSALTALHSSGDGSSAMPTGSPEILENSKTAQSSPAAAAATAEIGHILSPQEGADLVKTGQASRCAIITSPAGADVYVDGNKLGVSPIVFNLLRRGDTKRTITIKLSGYKTIEKTYVPDGKNIPLGLTLEKEN